jgi:hypothetical protein
VGRYQTFLNSAWWVSNFACFCCWVTVHSTSFITNSSNTFVISYHWIILQYCAMGLGLVGLDFRGLLPPIFEK